MTIGTNNNNNNNNNNNKKRVREREREREREGGKKSQVIITRRINHDDHRQQ